eukprot:TRINITY_DN6694_c0_g2_i1.p1 TRINITY_DN6694_c0_g2~~TRINITY_DN6694_c0_g2_i1.p1  ORF type:complete len:423 (+),score=116.80 TRINITY_DN6694_c0_g2_i1:310-1578(+)
MNRCESRDVSVTVAGNAVRDVGDYSLLGQLGKGGFSVVRHAVHRGTGREYACKILDQQKMNSDEQRSGRPPGSWKQALCLEIACMKVIKHRNVINVEEIMLTTRYVYIFMELSQCGTLFDRIKQCEKRTGRQGIPDRESAIFVSQIVCGLRCIHGNGVAHRDLKPDNILLTREGIVKITDFGLCRLHKASLFRSAEDELEFSAVGTLQYLPPECLNHSKHDAFKADLWSLGVVIYVMITGKFPFYDEETATLQRLICNGVKSITGLDTLTPEAQALVVSLIQVDPMQRASLADVWVADWLDEAVRDLGEILANESVLPVGAVLYGRHDLRSAPLFPSAGKTTLPPEGLQPTVSQVSTAVAADRRSRDAVLQKMKQRGAGGGAVGVRGVGGGGGGGGSEARVRGRPARQSSAPPQQQQQQQFS